MGFKIQVLEGQGLRDDLSSGSYDDERGGGVKEP